MKELPYSQKLIPILNYQGSRSDQAALVFAWYCLSVSRSLLGYLLSEDKGLHSFPAQNFFPYFDLDVEAESASTKEVAQLCSRIISAYAACVDWVSWREYLPGVNEDYIGHLKVIEGLEVEMSALLSSEQLSTHKA
jgi:hypothetical protein